MDAIQKDLVNLIQKKQEHMQSQLHLWCSINTSSFNLAGLSSLATIIQQAFEPLADQSIQFEASTFQSISMAGILTDQQCGKTLVFRKRPELKNRVLLVGHMDTVYPVDSPFQNLKYISDNCISGPGVSDMKGGLIVMLQALAAFEETLPAKNLGWDVFINADEEIGSPTSSKQLASLGQNYQAALVYEPAMDNIGTIAKNRRGSANFTIIAKGKAAHAGRAFYEGRNAICYLAEVLLTIHALNSEKDGVTINIGKIAGGEAVNMVPAQAVAKLDIRISDPEDEIWLRSKLDAIIKKYAREDYSLQIAGNFGRPVKHISKATESLFHTIQKVGKTLNLSIDWKDSGGCCDGNNIAAQGIPVIDTLGVRGGNIHSDAEFILLDSLVERASLSALLLLELRKAGGPAS